MTTTEPETPAPSAPGPSSRRPGRRLVGRGAVRRIVELLVVLLLVSFATAFIVDLLPGDPAAAILGDSATPERYEALRTELGLDKGLIPRYGDWLSNAVQGDLGESILPPGGPVIDKLKSALPVSLELAVLGLAISLIVSVPLALWSAWKPGGRVDRTITTLTFALVSMPSFVAGLLLILLLVKVWPVFPRASWVPLTENPAENLRHAFLPALVVAIPEIPVFIRVLRGDLIETMRMDFITAAKARGMSPRRILVSEALRPSSLSLATIAGVSLGRLIGSTVIAETLFGLPGIGSLIVRAAGSRDLALLQGAVVLVAVVYVLVNALVDISYTRLDPRLRRGRR